MRINPDGLFEVAIGLYFTLVGFGVVGASKNAEKNKEWLQKYGVFLKVVAPLVLLYGLASTFRLL